MSIDNSQKYEEILKSQAKKICVIAGPGSRKTKGILIPMAKKLMDDQSIDQKSVILLSFSRLSALDLKEKVKSINRSPRASTLHSLCLSFLLSENNHDIRDRVDSIILEFEKEFLISDIKVALSNTLRLNKHEIRKLLNEFSAGWAVKPHDEVFIENDMKIAFKNTVLNWLSEHKAAMMEEIVYHAVELAKKLNTDFINEQQYILVDEFQDMNKIEQEFLEILAENSKLILVVGDPDQSIYSFKFAHPNGINDFSKKVDVESHNLLFSGRCSKNILKVANQLLKQIDPTRSDILQALPNAADGDISLIEKNTQEEEFEFIYSSIKEKIESGVDPKEILVLVPKNKLGTEFTKYAKKKGRFTRF